MYSMFTPQDNRLVILYSAMYNSAVDFVFKVIGGYMELPRSVQEIVAVIGREQTLSLIGQLPVYSVIDKRHPNAKNTRVILYVPRTLNNDCALIGMIGWHDAAKMVDKFGGSLLYPGNCSCVQREFIVNTIKRMAAEGVCQKVIALTLDVSEKTVKRHSANNPHKDNSPANDNNPVINQIRASA